MFTTRWKKYLTSRNVFIQKRETHKLKFAEKYFISFSFFVFLYFSLDCLGFRVMSFRLWKILLKSIDHKQHLLFSTNPTFNWKFIAQIEKNIKNHKDSDKLYYTTSKRWGE